MISIYCFPNIAGSLPPRRLEKCTNKLTPDILSIGLLGHQDTAIQIVYNTFNHFVSQAQLYSQFQLSLTCDPIALVVPTSTQWGLDYLMHFVKKRPLFFNFQGLPLSEQTDFLVLEFLRYFINESRNPKYCMQPFTICHKLMLNNVAPNLGHEILV